MMIFNQSSGKKNNGFFIINMMMTIILEVHLVEYSIQQIHIGKIKKN
jgi:hypothetical protein